MTPAQTPERPVTTWSDSDLRMAVRDTFGPAVALSVDDLRRFVHALGAISPAECREREREAWEKRDDLGRTIWRGRHFLTRDEAWGIDSTGIYERERDRLYPSLLPASPPPLVLSTGEWERNEVGKYWACNNVSWNYPHVNTASDAEALAKWLRAYGDEQERG